MNDAELNDTYVYTVESGVNSATLSGSGTVTAQSQHVGGIDISSLPDGAITFSIQLTDQAETKGSLETDRRSLDTVAPSGYTIMADQAVIDASAASDAGFTFADATTGTTYNYTVASSDGGDTLTGSGTVTSASQDVAASTSLRCPTAR